MNGPLNSVYDAMSAPIVRIGGTPVAITGLIVAAAIVVIAIFLSRFAVRLIARLRTRMPGSGPALYILEKFTGYGIGVIGVLVALSAMGINLSSLAVFAGALGVGVGLGLQGVVKEFVSGLVLLFDNILHVGDFIELPGEARIRGTVFEIGTRAIHLRTSDNLDIFVPNSRLIEERFVNWTLRGQTRRIHIPFSVAYGVDKARVRQVVLEAANKVDFTSAQTETRRTQVWLTGFGDSALNFELVVWPTLDAVKRPAAMQAAYTWAIDDALRSEGIEIPYPQRDIRVRSVLGREGEDAYRALGFKTKPLPEEEAELEPPSQNDAAQDLKRPEEPPPPPEPRQKDRAAE